MNQVMQAGLAGEMSELALALFILICAVGIVVKIVRFVTGVLRFLRNLLPHRVSTSDAIDGDTLVLGRRRVRIAYIDAPELGQPVIGADGYDAGEVSKDACFAMIDGQKLKLKVIDRDIYGRDVAEVRTADVNLGLEMVRMGLARALDDAPEAYHDAEATARKGKIGLWADGGFTDPAAWRKTHAA